MIIAGYLLGSIPTGFLVARAKGVDIRAVGSGNIGATNVFRILGKGPGIFVLLVDALKGVAGCRLAPWIASMGGASFEGTGSDRLPLFLVLGGVSSILGHNYTCWLGFKGGKGVATTAGVLGALAPAIFGVALVVWGVVFGISRYVSLASIVAACGLPIITWLMEGGKLMTGVMTGVGLLAVYKHKANIQRLIQGTENRVGARKQSDSMEKARS